MRHLVTRAGAILAMLAAIAFVPTTGAAAAASQPRNPLPAAVAARSAVSVGYESACAVVSGGKVKCWGNNSYGQLGDGSTVNHATPVFVTSLTGATAVSAGWYGACAIVSGGKVKCWGYNYYGEVGNGTTSEDVPTPVSVSGISGATALASGGYGACVIVSGGKVKCWGYNYYGEVGNGT
ncbi:MAG TPA: hypothetical protein VK217_04530, partial [Acidimicrobiales bacterium]|nr:hypothetical protein [Acidimicrobiales bacterium]